MIDTIDGTAAVVVGDLAGKVHVVSLATGLALPGWQGGVADPGGLPIVSTPSISGAVIYVGTGDATSPTPGGYLALNDNGTLRWYRTINVRPGITQSSGVQAGLTVGTLQGVTTVVAGTLGQYEEELRATTGAVMPGFPWFAADSEFSTPSIVNLYGTGRDYIVEGGESTDGIAYGVQYPRGGHIRVLPATGNSGKTPPSVGLTCEYNPTQGVESSPAVGKFLAGGAVGIVVGTGITYPIATDSDKVIAVTAGCRLAWTASLDGTTGDSPALVDALGNNQLQIAEGTAISNTAGHNTGSVYLLNATNGRPYWTVNLPGEIYGSITSANLGGGYQDLLVPTSAGVYVIDGRTGQQIAVLGQGVFGSFSSPLVTDDADGTIGVTVTGTGGKVGHIAHWEIPDTNGALADEPGAWPMFHHDPQLTGTTIAPIKP